MGKEWFRLSADGHIVACDNAEQALATDPPVSEKQRRAMYAAASGHSTLGIPKSVGKEFVGKGDKAAGMMYVTKDGKVLMGKRADSGQWAFPGGMREPGEDAEFNARREAVEELGGAPIGKAKLYDRTYTPLTDDYGIDFSTYAQSVDKEFTPVLNNEHTEHAWVDPRSPPSPVHPGVTNTLNKMRGDRPAQDMTDEDWNGLVAGLLKFIGEEAEEPEHAEDEANNRYYDKDGRLHVKRSRISKANVCEYMGREIPGWQTLGLEPEKKYKLWRNPEELIKGATTFNNIPLLNKHVPVDITDHKPENVIGSTGTDAEFLSPYLYNSLVIWSKDGVEGVEFGDQKELSCAYHYKMDPTPGTTPDGEAYDGIMRDIVGNHVAQVKEGRAGPDVCVGDSAIPRYQEVFSMGKTVLSRKAVLAKGALLVALRPKLAMDAKGIDLTPVFEGISAKNFKEMKPKMLERITAITKGKLANDANLNDVTQLLDALEEVEEHEGKDADPNTGLPMAATMKPDHSMDAEEFLKGKLSSDDFAAYQNMKGAKAGDADAADEEDDDDKDKKAKDADADGDGDTAGDEEDDDKDKDMKGKDKKHAMDSKTVQTMVDSATKRERENQKAIREAERAVRPWVGDLALAFDSADEVYKKTLEMLGKKTEGIHPSAFPTILSMVPKPGTGKGGKDNHLAQDSAGGSKGFFERYPEAAKIGHV